MASSKSSFTNTQQGSRPEEPKRVTTELPVEEQAVNDNLSRVEYDTVSPVDDDAIEESSASLSSDDPTPALQPTGGSLLLDPAAIAPFALEHEPIDDIANIEEGGEEESVYNAPAPTSVIDAAKSGPLFADAGVDDRGPMGEADEEFLRRVVLPPSASRPIYLSGAQPEQPIHFYADDEHTVISQNPSFELAAAMARVDAERAQQAKATLQSQPAARRQFQLSGLQLAGLVVVASLGGAFATGALRKSAKPAVIDADDMVENEAAAPAAKLNLVPSITPLPGSATEREHAATTALEAEMRATDTAMGALPSAAGQPATGGAKPATTTKRAASATRRSALGTKKLPKKEWVDPFAE